MMIADTSKGPPPLSIFNHVEAIHVDAPISNLMDNSYDQGERING
jgi:hypothetical protein